METTKSGFLWVKACGFGKPVGMPKGYACFQHRQIETHTETDKPLHTLRAPIKHLIYITL